MAQARPAGGIVRFAQESWSELRKVTWPSRETVIRLTIIVLLISALIAAYIFAFDNLFTFTITRGLLGTPAASPTPGP
ncbi:MAG: preprotein translocase subunit SecE [Candidatus Limnocylindria bacterium]